MTIAPSVETAPATIVAPGQLPELRVLSLGAGVQSTALLILSAAGLLPKLDCAIFADTGWEPAAVYAHLDRLEREVAQPAGIPIHRVSLGNIRRDALDPNHRFASMPLYVKNQEGREGRTRRQCTHEYKLKPILRQVRTLLGARPKASGVPGPVPGGRWAEQWIGISTDEAHRALSIKALGYSQPRFPLLEPSIADGLSRAHCELINERAGFRDVPKSACIGCPYHSNRQWRIMRDQQPEEFADAVAFDRAIRAGSARANALGKALRGEMYLHRSLLPLDQAPIDRVTRKELQERQMDLVAELGLAEYAGGLDDQEEFSCGPFSCVTGSPVGGDYDLDDDEDEVA